MSGCEVTGFSAKPVPSTPQINAIIIINHDTIIIFEPDTSVYFIVVMDTTGGTPIRLWDVRIICRESEAQLGDMQYC